MTAGDISRIPDKTLFGGGGFLWAVAASPDKSPDIAGQGPVRSFVQSVMPKSDLIEIIITAALRA